MNIVWINAALSALAAAGLAASAMAWRHSLLPFNSRSPEWFFATAKVLYSIGFGLRLLFWDVLFAVLREVDRAAATHLSDMVGGTNGNAFTTVIILCGVYCSLKARQMLLLQDRGVDWHWTVAWAYPWGRSVRRMLGQPE